MIAHIKKILEKSASEGYAVGAFNIHNIEAVAGVALAAEKMRSPAIIQVSLGAIKYIGLKNVVDIVNNAAETLAPTVPIALHLDHGKDYDSVMACIDAGFSSVHMDGSSLPLDENIKVTKSVVDIAHKKDVWVQGEVGAMIGGHGSLGGVLENIPVVNPDDVIRFVKETGVDTIAAAVGTAHGVYENEDVKIPLLHKIIEKTKIPFVLHGGSGVKEDKIRKSVDEGVNIINIGSDIKIAFSRALIKNCAENKKETDPRKLLKPTMSAVTEVATEQMKIFKSINRY
jgi:fructose-bisphosphate aldolase, class II